MSSAGRFAASRAVREPKTIDVGAWFRATLGGKATTNYEDQQ